VSTIVTVLAWLLIPMGLLPVIAWLVLRHYANADSPTLRERARLQRILALLGLAVTLAAINNVFALNLGALVTIPFAVILLLVDVASGRWLWDAWRGRYQ